MQSVHGPAAAQLSRPHCCHTWIQIWNVHSPIQSSRDQWQQETEGFDSEPRPGLESQKRLSWSLSAVGRRYDSADQGRAQSQASNLYSRPDPSQSFVIKGCDSAKCKCLCCTGIRSSLLYLKRAWKLESTQACLPGPNDTLP